ncbi:glycerol-3-phosphate transporter [uncultured Anaerococcus sp.]|nr:glycerol-3-phosphate transporter [uncultured Anaerococcus sp.]
MDRVKKYKKDYPTSYFMIVSFITIFLFYKFGYAIGKFVAHLGF